jgi:hypothetical protein
LTVGGVGMDCGTSTQAECCKEQHAVGIKIVVFASAGAHGFSFACIEEDCIAAAIVASAQRYCFPFPQRTIGRVM